MEFDASWSVDKKNGGMEKTFCCLNTRARDSAKFGRLFLKKGNWQGKEIIPENWCTQSIHPDRSAGGANYYQLQWWVQDGGIFRAEGIMGQFIMVDPKREMIMVRLGSQISTDWWNLGPALMKGISERR